MQQDTSTGQPQQSKHVNRLINMQMYAYLHGKSAYISL